MSKQGNDEKASTLQSTETKKRGFFSRKRKAQSDLPKDKDSETASSVSGGAAEKDDKPKEAEVIPVSFAQMFRFSTKFELTIDAIGLVAAAAAGAAQPVMTILFGKLTKDFVGFSAVLADPSRSDEIPAAGAAFRHAASQNAIYLVCIGIAMFVATYTYMYIWVYTAEVNAKRIRERYLRSVLRQDIAFFDNVGAGEVATRIQTDTHLVQQGMSEKVPLALQFIAAFITGFIIAYIRQWKLALALSSILPCIGITGALMNKAVSKYMQMALKHVADGGSVAEEVISTIRTAQAFGTQKTLSSMYDKHIGLANRVDAKAAVWHGGGLGIFFFVIYSAYALAFNFGTTLVLRGEADIGKIVNVFLAILIGSFSLALLAPEMQAITHGRGAAAKLFATIDRVPPIDSANPGGAKPSNLRGDIELKGINFSYPSRPNVPVVKDLSLSFPAGKSAALVGASGSGKSTVISLVERFYDPHTGTVKIDGVDIKDWNVKYLRSQIGLVSQEPTLFATTIWGNVAHGLINTPHEHASHEEKTALIKEACIKANADGFIGKLPNGYETMVGERGFLLSGGQKQRIAIARAIVSDPKILLLDEATSALDTQSEGVVQDALDKAAAGRTTITIAHRLSTIKDADQIYVMGEGRVLEQGTHDELLSNGDSSYSRLVAAQKLREAKEQAAVTADDDASASSSTEKLTEKDEMERQLREEVPLGRKNTSTSLASEILEKRRRERGEAGKGEEEDYSMYYLFKRMGAMNRAGWKNYAIGALFAIATGCVYPAFGIVYAIAVQGFSNPDREHLRHSGDRTALWFFIISILSAISICGQNFLFARAAASLTQTLRSLSFKAILRQDIEFFDKDENSSGSLTAALSDNPQKVNGLAGITLGAIVQSIATLISGCILGLAFIWKVALVGIATIPFLISTGYIRLRVVVLKDQANKKSHEASAQLACEAAAAIRTVASLTREDDCCNLYSESLEEPLKRSNRTALWSNALYAFSQSIIFFVIALVFWYGARLISFLEFTTQDFFVGLMSTTFGAIQAGNVFSFVPDMSSARGAASDILRLIDSIPEIDAESPDGKMVDLEKVKGHIKLENVHFRYPTRPGVRVLRGLNIQVEPGTYIALVGASGCGKSTVIQLIERFYDPLAGEVYLDGQKITELNIQDYRKQIALVSQEPTLYSGSVRFNILLGAIKPHEEITQEEIEDACRKANILDFIKGLPDGFDTEVGGKGSQLSGGQKQRIAIARALLRNPKVLLLDEATSALDSQSEKVVQAALDEAAKGRTTIAIAHRLSTIQNANRIYFIKEGNVSESGTHDQLISRKGDYYEYVQLQGLSKREHA